MKKNVALRVAAILFILTIITGCFASQILAENAGLTQAFLPHSFSAVVQMTANIIPFTTGG